MGPPSELLRRSSVARWLAAVGVVALVAGGGWLVGSHLAAEHREDLIRGWRERLTAVAQARRLAVEDWVGKGVRDAELLASYPTVRYVAQGRSGPPYPFPVEAGAQAHLRELSRAFLRREAYIAALILDRDGRLLLREGEATPDEPHHFGFATPVLQGARPIVQFHLHKGKPVVVFVVAIPPGDAAVDGSPVGAAALVADPARWLYPLLAVQSAASRTGETVLMRREGETVRFLSPLRYASGGPLEVVRPLDVSGFAALAAVEGQEAFGEFVDYRPAPVFAAVTRVRGTEWGLVAKVDRSEVLAAYRGDVLSTLALAGSWLLAVAAVTYAGWRRRQSRLARRIAESEARFVGLMQQANDAILFLGSDGRIIDANRRAEDFYGYGRDELLSMRIHDLDAPDEKAAIPERMAMVRQRSGAVFEATHVHRDGRLLPVEVSSRFEPASGLFIALIRDVGERKAAQERERFLNRLLRTISEINQLIVRERDPDALLSATCQIVVEHGEFPLAWVGVADRGSGEVRRVAWAGDDGGYLEIARVRCDDAPGGRGPTGRAIRDTRVVTVDDIRTEEHFEPWRDAALARSFRSCVALPFEVNGAPWILEVFGTQPGVFKGEVLALLEELAGDLSYALSALERDRRRVEAEEALRQTRETLDAVFGAAPVAIFGLDADGVVTFWNPGAEAMFGWSAAEAVGHANPLVPADKKAEFQSLVRRVLAGETISGQELTRVCKDGSPLEIVLSATPLRDAAGVATGVAAIAMDVTKHREVEEHLRRAQRIEAIGQLAGGIAHDFNNLLQAMLSIAEVLQRLPAGSPQAADRVGELRRHLQRGAQLARQLLLFSRREAVKLETVDLNEVVRGATALLERLLPENVTLRIVLADGRLPVRADRGQLEQVVMNLALNARDAMPGGGTIAVRTAVAADGSVLLEVEDGGSGIAEAARKHVFEPFFTTKERGKGTGLGLAVVHGIVSRHGGTIAFDTTPGKGTLFRVVLPRTGSGEYPRVEEVREEPPVAEGGEGERVLVVEDEDGAREALQEIVGLLGYQVMAVESATAATALPAEPPFDLLLTDYLLPDAVGSDLAAVLRRRWPGIAVIVMSGYTEDVVMRRNVEDGRVRFLQKPFDAEILARELRAALQG